MADYISAIMNPSGLPADIIKAIEDENLDAFTSKWKVWNMNDTTREGFTALMLASKKGNREIVEFLLKRYADVHKISNDGSTALMLACEGERDNHLIVIMLCRNHADVNKKKKNGSTALTLAAENGHLKIVKELCDRNADIDSTDGDANTAIMLACKYGHLEVVKELHTRHANLTTKNKDGLTALQLAIQYGDIDIVQELSPIRASLLSEPVNYINLFNGQKRAENTGKHTISKYLTNIMQNRLPKRVPKRRRSYSLSPGPKIKLDGGRMRSLKHSNNPRKRSRRRR